MKLFKVKTKFNKGGSEKQYVLTDDDAATVQAALEVGYAAAGRQVRSISIVVKANDQQGDEGAPLMYLDGAPIWPITEALHLRSVGHYDVVGVGRVQSSAWFRQDEKGEYVSVDTSPMVGYRAQSDGSWWFRPYDEFTDGRFETKAALEEPPLPARREGRGQS